MQWLRKMLACSWDNIKTYIDALETIRRLREHLAKVRYAWLHQDEIMDDKLGNELSNISELLEHPVVSEWNGTFINPMNDGAPEPDWHKIARDANVDNETIAILNSPNINDAVPERMVTKKEMFHLIDRATKRVIKNHKMARKMEEKKIIEF